MDVETKVEQLQRLGLGAVPPRAYPVHDDDPDSVFQVGEVCPESLVALHAGPGWIRSWLSRMGVGASLLVSDLGQVGARDHGQVGVRAAGTEAGALGTTDGVQGKGARDWAT